MSMQASAMTKISMTRAIARLTNPGRRAKWIRAWRERPGAARR